MYGCFLWSLVITKLAITWVTKQVFTYWEETSEKLFISNIHEFYAKKALLLDKGVPESFSTAFRVKIHKLVCHFPCKDGNKIFRISSMCTLELADGKNICG